MFSAACRHDKSFLNKNPEPNLRDIAFEMAKPYVEGEIPENDLKKLINDAYPFPAMLAARWAYLAKNADGDAFLAATSAVWLHAAASDALVAADPPGDPSVANTARAAASLRVALERTAAR